MIATLETVELRRGGGVLTAAVTAGATTLPLDFTLDYNEAGGLLEVDGVTYTYTAVGEDFVTLASGLVADAEVDTPAWTVDAQGNREETWKAWVDLGDGGDTVPALIPTDLIGYFPEGDAAIGQAVEVFDTDAGLRVGNRPAQQVLLDGAAIDLDTLPPMPGGQTISDDAPVDTTGYPEDYGWWQVVAGEVVGFWRLTGGVWTPATVVTEEALVANNAIINALNGETITGVTITGSTVRTAASGPRWVMTSVSSSELLGYSGGASESQPGSLQMSAVGSDYFLNMTGPKHSSAASSPQLQMRCNATGSKAEVAADTIKLTGADVTLDGEATWNTGGSWTAYTPTFTASTTNPTLGNFTRTGRWTQWGKTVRFSIVITCNAASGFGSGTYDFGLPVPARDGPAVVPSANQGGPNHMYIGRGAGTSPASTFSLFLTSTDAAMTAANSGMTSGTILRISGTYEAA